MLKVTEALEQIVDSVASAEPTHRLLADVLNCRLAHDVISSNNSPPFDKSMMDGFAVSADDVDLQGESLRRVELSICGELMAGHETDIVVRPGSALRIMTGAPIPNGANAVIPVEQSEVLAGDTVSLLIERQIQQGTNIIRCGQNMQAGETVLRAGQQIRPQEIALLAELGQAEVLVHSPPRVAILATGDELVEIDQTPGPGQIRNSNATMLAAQVKAAGAVPHVLPIARDRREDLRSKIEEGLKYDFLCLSGGVSAGQLDLVPSELSAAGVQEVFHKVAMKPGKPIWFGRRKAKDAQSACYVFGLPGNPISSMICFELFVKTALIRFQNQSQVHPPLVDAVLQRDFTQRGNREVWFPSLAEIDNSQIVVTPTRWKGSSDILSTTQANCSICFPAAERTFAAGETVQVLVWSGSCLRPKLATD